MLIGLRESAVAMFSGCLFRIISLPVIVIAGMSRELIILDSMINRFCVISGDDFAYHRISSGIRSQEMALCIEMLSMASFRSATVNVDSSPVPRYLLLYFKLSLKTSWYFFCRCLFISV